MSNGMKRFFYFWRFPLIFFVLFWVLLWLTTKVNGDAGGILSAIWLFIVIPGLLFFTIRSIYLWIRSVVTYHRTGIRDEVLVFSEVDFVCGIIDAIADEIDSIRELSGSMKLRYLGFRIVGIGLVIAGSIGAILCYPILLLVVIWSLVIIAGATLWIMANPSRYNLRVSGARMVPFHGDIAIDELFNVLKTISTSLGTPEMANVRGFKNRVIVYGSSSDAYIYVVYRAHLFDYYYVSTIASYSLNEELLDNLNTDESTDKNIQDFAYYLDELADTVKEAVAIAAVD